MLIVRLLLLLVGLLGCAHGEMTTRHYKWTYDGKQLDFMLQFEAGMARAYKSIPRVRGDYTAYCMDPQQQPLLNFIVARFRDFAKQNRWSDAQTISMMISFVQSLPYTSDKVTTKHDEYPRYPIETLADNGGDCEDTSILLAALLRTMKYDVVLLQGPHHMAVGVGVPAQTRPLGAYRMTMVRSGPRNYAYLETTGSGYQVGEYPAEAHASPAEFQAVPLLVRPVLGMDVKVSTATVMGAAQLTVKIRNDGSAPASAFVQAWFDTQPRTARAGNKSDVFQLKPGSWVELKMGCPMPTETVRKMQLNVEAVDAASQGSLKTWQSQWVDL